MIKKRDHSIDIWKGLLVIFMVYCHVLQFFSAPEYYKMGDIVINAANVITFHSFVFCFGMTCYIAYLSKPFDKVWKKMLRTALRCYFAFVISGLAYLVLVGSRIPGKYLIRDLMLLNEIPGWSEFLIAFAFFILMALIFFKAVNKLLENKKLFWIVTLLLFLSGFIPYEQIKFNQVGLLIGTMNFPSFPVLQHMPFFLVGMYVVKYDIKFNWKILIGSFILTSIGIVYILFFNNGKLPERFPPSIFWIILPSFFVYLYYLICKKLDDTPFDFYISRSLGANSLFYLVMSNILIFSLEASRTMSIIGPFVGLVYTIIILIICWLISGFTTRIARKEKKI